MTQTRVASTSGGAWESIGLTPQRPREADHERFVFGRVWAGGTEFWFQISNGWRLDPLHLRVSFIFLDADGNELGRVSKYGWCPASGGGRGQEQSYRFTTDATSLWARAATITVLGEVVAPQGGPRGEGLKPDASITYSKTF